MKSEMVNITAPAMPPVMIEVIAVLMHQPFVMLVSLISSKLSQYTCIYACIQ